MTELGRVHEFMGEVLPDLNKRAPRGRRRLRLGYSMLGIPMTEEIFMLSITLTILTSLLQLLRRER